MRVLFLDVDGVLNCNDDFTEDSGIWVINDQMFMRLKIILDRTSCKVVLTSSWRFSPQGLAKISGKLQNISHDIFDVTPLKDEINRELEIGAWLLDHPEVTSWVVVDDWHKADLNDGSFIRTHADEGLTDHHVAMICDFFDKVTPIKNQ
jgi:hypothetical protein